MGVTGADHSDDVGRGDIWRMAYEQYRQERWDRVPILWRAGAAFHWWGVVVASHRRGCAPR